MGEKIKKYLSLFTIFGIGIYVVLFAFAAYIYPGGSYYDACQHGFSFFHNYWCDLMNPVCEIGVENPAQSIAVLGHFVLSGTTASFFYNLPRLFVKENRNAKIVRFFGVFSMVIFLFMFTDWHGEVILGTALFGSVALFTAFFELKKIESKAIFRGAILCLFSCIFIFLTYELNLLIYWLAFLQKITMLLCLAWIALVSWEVWKLSEG